MVGRPRKKDTDRGRSKQIFLQPRHIEWLEAQGDGQQSRAIQDLIDKEIAGSDREAARLRMAADPDLAQYVDHIFSDQWPSWVYEWILRADKAAILDWIDGPKPEEL